MVGACKRRQLGETCAADLAEIQAFLEICWMLARKLAPDSNSQQLHLLAPFLQTRDTAKMKMMMMMMTMLIAQLMMLGFSCYFSVTTTTYFFASKLLVV